MRIEPEYLEKLRILYQFGLSAKLIALALDLPYPLVRGTITYMKHSVNQLSPEDIGKFIIEKTEDPEVEKELKKKAFSLLDYTRPSDVEKEMKRKGVKPLFTNLED